MSPQFWIEVLQGLLTPVVAAVVAYIAWQQMRTNRQRFDLERYERRLRIYKEVKKVLSIIVRDANVGTEDLLKFITSTSEADFLFGKEVREYIDEIYHRGLALHRWNSEYRDYTQEKPEGYDHKKVVDNMHIELEWLSQQFEPAKNLFMKYLHIGR